MTLEAERIAAGAADPPATTNQGGLDAWAPRTVPGVGVEMDNEAVLACAFRILAAAGFSENIAGHITWTDRDDGSMLVNPWGLWWEEITADDVCRVDRDANVIEGRWDVTPAIHIHTELHRAHPAARVVVHNHPYWSTVLAALGHLPDIFHQTGCMFDQEMVFVDEYDGEVADAAMGADLAHRIGTHPVALLANHGVIVTGSTVTEAVYRAASFDRQCRLAYHVLVAGGDPSVVPDRVRTPMKRSLIERGADVYWAGAVRRLLRHEPEVLGRDGRGR